MFSAGPSCGRFLLISRFHPLHRFGLALQLTAHLQKEGPHHIKLTLNLTYCAIYMAT